MTDKSGTELSKKHDEITGLSEVTTAQLEPIQGVPTKYLLDLTLSIHTCHLLQQIAQLQRDQSSALEAQVVKSNQALAQVQSEANAERTRLQQVVQDKDEQLNQAQEQLKKAQTELDEMRANLAKSNEQVAALQEKLASSDREIGELWSASCWIFGFVRHLLAEPHETLIIIFIIIITTISYSWVLFELLFLMNTKSDEIQQVYKSSQDDLAEARNLLNGTVQHIEEFKNEQERLMGEMQTKHRQELEALQFSMMEVQQQRDDLENKLKSEMENSKEDQG